MGSDPEGNNTPMGLAALNGYFDNVVAAATNKKKFLEELVTKITTLTTSNPDMEDTIKKLTVENLQLQQQLTSLRNLPQEERGSG